MWFNPDGAEMTDQEWEDERGRTLGMLLSGDAMDVRDERGEPIKDDTFLVIFNAAAEPVKFCLPGKEDVIWELLLDTQHEAGFFKERKTRSAGNSLPMVERSLCLLRLSTPTPEKARSGAKRRMT